MRQLYQETSINQIRIPNRFVRSATWEGMATADGRCTPELIACLTRLAQGGVGLIITGHAYVAPEGKASVYQLGVYADDLEAGLSELAAAVHAAGRPLVMQLAHAGCRAAPDVAGAVIQGPSARAEGNGPACQAMTLEEIQETVEAFGRAALRAQRAGFDGVQIHAAHGYLLSQFLSPFYNQRTDAYGGTIANRTRLVCEVLQRIRACTGSEFAILAKLNAEDFLEDGFSVDDMLYTAARLAELGLDALEISGGTTHSGALNPIRTTRAPSPELEAYYGETVRRLRTRVDLPLILVGGIRSYETAAQYIHADIVDYIAMCRPLICEPDLIQRWQAGDTARSACRSDNQCFRPALSGRGIYCVTMEKARRKPSRDK